MGLGGKIGLERGNIGAKSALFEPELTTYMGGLTTPLSAGQRTKLNNFIKTLKTGFNINALSDAADVIRIPAIEDSDAKVRNLVKNAHHATAVNAPVFTALEGWTGNGTSSYIEENFIPATDGVRFTQNSASLFYYFRSLAGISGVYSDTNRFLRVGKESGGNITIIINENYINPANYIDSAFAGGFLGGSRINATTVNAYLNGTKTLQVGTSTTPPSNSLITLARRTYDGSVGLFDASQYSFMWIGRALTDAEELVLRNAIETYMDSNGKGVIA